MLQGLVILRKSHYIANQISVTYKNLNNPPSYRRVTSRHIPVLSRPPNSPSLARAWENDTGHSRTTQTRIVKRSDL